MTQIVMTNSFRGGTGKSTIISNLSYNMALLGKKVLIIDLDIISPGVHAIFGLDKKSFSKTFTDYLIGEADIIDSVYDISKSVDLPEAHLFLIPSKISESDIVGLLQQEKNFEKLAKGLDKIKEEFKPDFIMIDTHPGLNEEFLVATDFTDVLLNIIRPDNQDYQGAQVAAEVSRKVNLKTYFIINKVHHKIKENQLKKNIEKAFKLPVAGMLPLSDEIILSQSQYVFSEKYPRHKFSQEIQKIVLNVFGLKPKAHLEIMHDLLLEISSKGKVKEPSSYLKRLLSERFIEGKEDNYIITLKGNKFLEKYKIIRRFVDDFRL